MSPLFLIGPRGSGKTLAAARLAETLACRACDTDAMIQAKGRSIAEIVAREGWAAFRAMEKEALALAVAEMTAAPGAPGVIATGGGIVLDEANRELMRASGVVAYLSAPAETLIARLEAAQSALSSRPPLSGLALADEVRAVLREREPLYRATAHHVIDAGRDPDMVCRDLHTLLTIGAPS